MIKKTITSDELFVLRGNRIPVVTQEKKTGRILGLNITNKEAFDRTVKSGECHYYDDACDMVYLKGEHSGEVETILEIRWDACHARRHEAHLLYIVDMAEGKCKFGVTDCHFYIFNDGWFVFDQDCICDPAAVSEFKERIEIFLTQEEDFTHRKRFIKL